MGSAPRGLVCVELPVPCPHINATVLNLSVQMSAWTSLHQSGRFPKSSDGLVPFPFPYLCLTSNGLVQGGLKDMGRSSSWFLFAEGCEELHIG